MHMGKPPRTLGLASPNLVGELEERRLRRRIVATKRILTNTKKAPEA